MASELKDTNITGTLAVSAEPSAPTHVVRVQDLSAAIVLPLSDTAANLAAVVPLAGQVVYITDTKETRVGDGTTAVASLQFAGSRVLKQGTLTATLPGTPSVETTIGTGLAFPVSSVIEVTFLCRTTTADVTTQFLIAGTEFDPVTNGSGTIKLYKGSNGNAYTIPANGGAFDTGTAWTVIHAGLVQLDIGDTTGGATVDYIVQQHNAH